MAYESWKYNQNNYDPNEVGVLPVGYHRVRIKEICPKTSLNGNDMWEIVFEVSGRGSLLWYYLVFLQDNPKMTDQRLGQIFDSFAITPGNMDHMSWIGKVGGVKIKHEEYNGDTKAKISYFLKRNKVDELPPWEEPNRSENGGNSAVVSVAPSTGMLPPPPPDASANAYTSIVDDKDLPF